jgi:hypothetical protein
MKMKAKLGRDSDRSERAEVQSHSSEQYCSIGNPLRALQMSSNVSRLSWAKFWPSVGSFVGSVRLATPSGISNPTSIFHAFGFATSLRHASETSNRRSNFTQKRNCHCCVQRIGEQMRDGHGEGDSLIARRIAVFRPDAGYSCPVNCRF